MTLLVNVSVHTGQQHRAACLDRLRQGAATRFVADPSVRKPQFAGDRFGRGLDGLILHKKPKTTL